MASPFWIPTDTPGRLAILARPRGGDWLPDDVADWKRFGLHTAVSMLTAEEENELELDNEADESVRAGLQYIACPVEDSGLPSDIAGFSEIVAEVASELTDGHSIGIHCRQGIGRSGLLAIAIVRTIGVSPEEAISRVSAARGRPL